MSEKDYVEQILSIAESGFKYLIGLLSADIALLLFGRAFFGIDFPVTAAVVFGIVCFAGLILCTLTIRRYVRRLSKL